MPARRQAAKSSLASQHGSRPVANRSAGVGGEGGKVRRTLEVERRKATHHRPSNRLVRIRELSVRPDQQRREKSVGRTALLERVAKVLDLAVLPVVRLVKRDVPKHDSFHRRKQVLVRSVEDGAEHRPVLVGEFVLSGAINEVGPVPLLHDHCVVRPGSTKEQVLKFGVPARKERLKIET